METDSPDDIASRTIEAVGPRIANRRGRKQALPVLEKAIQDSWTSTSYDSWEKLTVYLAVVLELDGRLDSCIELLEQASVQRPGVGIDLALANCLLRKDPSSLRLAAIMSDLSAKNLRSHEAVQCKWLLKNMPRGSA